MNFFDLPDNLDINHSQLNILSRLSKIIMMLEERMNVARFFFKNPQSYIKGVYLFGAVGRGKTTLMNAFFNRIDVDHKKNIHYQDFMQMVHADLHKLRSLAKDKAVIMLAKQYAKNIKILCVDEFEIIDIADAMIIKRLFPALIKNKVFIFVTSNSAPQDLYKNGLQRDLFLSFIDIIKAQFDIMEVCADCDYRLDKVRNVAKRILHPINAENELVIYKAIQELGGEDKFTPGHIEFFGRHLHFEKIYDKILLTNFNELFMRDLGYVDYVNICKKFSIIIIPDVKILDENNTNLLTRFINFIDNAYFHKVLLFMLLEFAPEMMCSNTKKIDSIKRAASRMYEMNSAEYFKSAYEKLQ